MRDFTGKTAVVTGAASGIGLAMAERLAAEGMRIVLADVEEEPLARAAQELDQRGAAALAVPTDVTKPAEVEALGRAAVEAFGGVHVFCNNAGVGGEPKRTWELSLEGWQWVLGVNLWGVIHGIRTFTPILLAQEGTTHLINTASMAGHLSLPYGAPYHATKHAVVTISECMHHELTMTDARLKVSVLCPGFVRTAIAESERNRPAELTDADERMREADQGWREVLRGLVASGIDPAAVAECVLDAIREERFWIFSHPDLLPAVRKRMETILAQGNPTETLPDIVPFAPPAKG